MASRGVNRATVLGNLGADPDVRMMPDGSPVLTISLATSETWTDKQTNEKKERTDWHRVVFFRKAAEIIGQYCRKGSKLYVEGRMQTREWEDEKGIKRYITEIIAGDFQLLGNSENSGNRPPPLGEKMPSAGTGQQHEQGSPTGNTGDDGGASPATSASSYAEAKGKPTKPTPSEATAPSAGDEPPHFDSPPAGLSEEDFDDKFPF